MHHNGPHALPRIAALCWVHSQHCGLSRWIWDSCQNAGLSEIKYLIIGSHGFLWTCGLETSSECLFLVEVFGLLSFYLTVVLIIEAFKLWEYGECQHCQGFNKSVCMQCHTTWSTFIQPPQFFHSLVMLQFKKLDNSTYLPHYFISDKTEWWWDWTLSIVSNKE